MYQTPPRTTERTFDMSVMLVLQRIKKSNTYQNQQKSPPGPLFAIINRQPYNLIKNDFNNLSTSLFTNEPNEPNEPN